MIHAQLPMAGAIDSAHDSKSISRDTLELRRLLATTASATISLESASSSLQLATVPVRLEPLTSRALGTGEQAAPQDVVIKMASAAVAEVVDGAPGQATSPAPQAEMAQTPSEITGEQLRALPSSGRHWEDFLVLSSGAAASVEVNSATSSAANAATNVDGVDTRLTFGSAAGSSQPVRDTAESSAHESQEQQQLGSGWSGRDVSVSESAVSSVQTPAVNQSASAEFMGRGLVGVATEHGGDALHGQAFSYDRQNTWGARNPYTTWVQNTGTAAAPHFEAVPFTPPDHELAWGFGAGSRLRRNKLFWFAALDGYHRNDPGVASVRNFAELFAPVEATSAQMVQLSAQLGESQNQAYDDYMGIPRAGVQQAGLEQLAELLGPAARSASQWVGFARLDWKAGERHSIALEGNMAEWNAPGGGMTRTLETYGSRSFGSSHISREWLTAKWDAFLTANLLATTQGSASRTDMTALPEAPSDFEKPFLNGNSYGQLPQIVVDSRYGFTIGNPSRFGQGAYPEEHKYSAQETLIWVKGHVLLRGGLQVDHEIDAITLLRNQTGTFHYTKLQSFISDASAFERFGTSNLLTYQNPHNCNATGKGLGALPCYNYFTQTLGPNFWQVSTNDWAGFITAQWQLKSWAVASAGLRWELEQLPAPMKLVDNPELPLTERLPDPGNQWGPRLSVALGERKRWPILRVGYGMYFGRAANATLLAAITQTGSTKGNLSVFVRPTDGFNPITATGAAPPFPNPLNGLPANILVPGAVEYATNFRNPEVHQAEVSLEQKLPGNLTITASASLSLGRRLPVSIDTNFDLAVNPKTITYAVKDATGKGPIKTTQITLPFYALWPAANCKGSPLSIAGNCGRANPDYQQITQIMSRSNSTYEAATVRVVRNGRRGLSFNARYTYSHAMDWSPNESTLVAGSDVLDPANFRAEYGTGNLDVRHAATAMVIFDSPWKVRKLEGHLANGWTISGTGQFHSGLPYSMRTTGSIPTELDANGNASIIGIGPGMNGSGGDNRVYGVGRNTFRYPQTWKADVRVGKKIGLGESRQLELLAESFNLFNHRNVAALQSTGYEIENGTYGTMPTLNYLTQGTTGTAATTPAFGQPLNVNGTNFFRERQIQFGMRLRF